MKNPCAKTSVLEFVFNEIAGINSRLAFLMKKRLHQRHSTFNILELSALLQEGVTQAPFFHETEGCAPQGCNIIKKQSTIDLFLRIWLFKTASVWYIFKKVSVMSYLNSKVAV